MNSYCPVCKENPAISPHHIRPRAEGGTDDWRNIVYLCKRCHDIVEEIYNETGIPYSPWLVGLIEKLHGFSSRQQCTAVCNTLSGQSSDYLKAYARVYYAAYYVENRERCLERMRKYEAENKEHLKRCRAEYRREHRESINAKIAEWRDNNREEYNASVRKWRVKQHALKVTRSILQAAQSIKQSYDRQYAQST